MQPHDNTPRPAAIIHVGTQGFSVPLYSAARAEPALPGTYRVILGQLEHDSGKIPLVFETGDVDVLNALEAAIEHARTLATPAREHAQVTS